MDVDEILCRVADDHNTTVDAVRAEIEKAVRDGQRSRAFCDAFGEREPTVDEYVQKLTEIILRKKDCCRANRTACGIEKPPQSFYQFSQ